MDHDWTSYQAEHLVAAMAIGNRGLSRSFCVSACSDAREALTSFKPNHYGMLTLTDHTHMNGFEFYQNKETEV